MSNPEPASELDQVVAEVVSEAHVKAEALRPEEREYLKEHALKKPMGVLHIWALGVGVVITGEYFGWNAGLKEGGPIGMLLASLFVCALYMMWVLALSELSVAMPFAGGPLAYGRRAVGPAYGFLMGWSMFLEALFATIGTAIATGGYINYVLQQLFPAACDENLTTTLAGLATVLGALGHAQYSPAGAGAQLLAGRVFHASRRGATRRFLGRRGERCVSLIRASRTKPRVSISVVFASVAGVRSSICRLNHARRSASVIWNALRSSARIALAFIGPIIGFSPERLAIPE